MSQTRRIAGAPVTWGVCEVPGWGEQLPPQQVVEEMAEIGLTATELGPDGFLPDDPAEIVELLAAHGLALVAGFVPAVLHRRDRLDAELEEVERRARLLAAAGAELLVLAATTGTDGYEAGADLPDGAWHDLAAGIARVEQIAGRLGLATVLHPHYGTLVATRPHIDRLLETSEVDLCLDTGHLLVGGADPVDVTRAAAARIRHVHLKDVDAAMAERVRAGQIGYRDAVAAGLYRVLGEGDVDVAEIIATLQQAGYEGWFVLEQDTVLEGSKAGTRARDAAAASLGALRATLLTAAGGGAA